MEDRAAPLIDLEAVWNCELKAKAIDPLKVILDEGFKQGKQFTNHEYMATYTLCYDMCTQRAPYNCSEHLYLRHGETFVEYLNDTVLPQLRNRHDVYLLQELVRRWQNHKIMNRWMKRFFTYLDRFYVKYHSLASLEEAGLKHFKTIVYESVKNDATNAILELINQERENVVVDRDLIKSCVDLYGCMGLGHNDVYETDLESHLLTSSREYYARKSDLWMTDDSTPAYLVKAEKALDEEKERVLAYLNPVTELKLMAVVENELLEKKKMALVDKDGSGMRVLLVNDRVQDLSRMFLLFSRLKEGGLTPMADILREHIANLGFEIMEARRARIENLKEKETSHDPQLVKELIDLHDKYIDMVATQFTGNSLFQKALRDAFSEVFNRDVGTVKNADLMSSFCDEILKKGGEKLGGESEIEDYLEKIVQLFSYLSHKDIFAEIYRNQLAKRLLNQRSASDDMEKLMISKLKLRCGNQFTSKMEGMLTDLQIGKDHQTAFERFYKEGNLLSFAHPIDYSVQVLTTGYWPTYKLYDVILPTVMSGCCQVFRTFYENETSGRRLQWVHSLGDAVVKGYFGGKKPYEFQLSTLQAAALLAFNSPTQDAVSISYAELADTLQLPEEALKRVLHSLACGKYKILKKDGPANAIKSSDVFTANSKFTSKRFQFRVPIATLEESHNPKRVEEDRGHTIEASIVRIMKARKTLGHQQLIGEVLTQLSFFRPDAKKIKRHIEALIEREYLERDQDSRDVYKYLA